MPLDLLVRYPTKAKTLVSFPRTAEEGGILKIKNITKKGFMYWTGDGKIVGTVKRKTSPVNTPLRRKVFLIDETLGNTITDMTWSNETTWNYEFRNLDRLHTYSVFSQDYLHTNRAVMADNLTPEPM